MTILFIEEISTIECAIDSGSIVISWINWLFKKQISNDLSVGVDKQRLVIDGKQIADNDNPQSSDNRLLTQYITSDNSIVYLLHKKDDENTATGSLMDMFEVVAVRVV